MTDSSMTKRAADGKIALPMAKRAKAAFAQWDDSFIEHAAKSDEIG